MLISLLRANLFGGTGAMSAPFAGACCGRGFLLEAPARICFCKYHTQRPRRLMAQGAGVRTDPSLSEPSPVATHALGLHLIALRVKKRLSPCKRIATRPIRTVGRDPKTILGWRRVQTYQVRSGEPPYHKLGAVLGSLPGASFPHLSPRTECRNNKNG